MKPARLLALYLVFYYRQPLLERASYQNVSCWKLYPNPRREWKARRRRCGAFRVLGHRARLEKYWSRRSTHGTPSCTLANNFSFWQMLMLLAKILLREHFELSQATMGRENAPPCAATMRCHCSPNETHRNSRTMKSIDFLAFSEMVAVLGLPNRKNEIQSLWCSLNN
jgi:hypothetical protein